MRGTWFRNIVAISCALLVAGDCSAKALVYLRIEPVVIRKYLALSPPEQSRLVVLRRLFEKAGCAQDNITQQSIPGEPMPNLICVLPGLQSAETVLIGAGVGYHEGGSAALVPWGSALMLPLLAESMNSVPHRNTLVFVAFAGSELGHTGLSWYLNHLARNDRKQIRALVTIESVGSGRPGCVVAMNGRASLLDPLLAAAQTLRMVPPSEVSSTNVSVQAGEHFQIPAVTFTSSPPLEMQYTIPGEDLLPVLQESVRLQDYTDAYNLLCVYLLCLDNGSAKHKQHHWPLLR